jgi:hypothetical protein
MQIGKYTTGKAKDLSAPLCICWSPWSIQDRRIDLLKNILIFIINIQYFLLFFNFNFLNMQGIGGGGICPTLYLPSAAKIKTNKCRNPSCNSEV